MRRRMRRPNFMSATLANSCGRNNWHRERGESKVRPDAQVRPRRRGMSSTEKVRLNVNGTEHELEVEPRLLLVHALRDQLGLTGTHVGCDTSNCGACTVHMNGEAVKSCTILAVQAEDAEITTIEGM